jgi:hypothetical protein
VLVVSEALRAVVHFDLGDAEAAVGCDVARVVAQWSLFLVALAARAGGRAMEHGDLLFQGHLAHECTGTHSGRIRNIHPGREGGVSQRKCGAKQQHGGRG